MTAPLKTLTIIGCGKVGRTLGRLWASSGTFSICDILNRTVESSMQAVAFVGAGRATVNYQDLRIADVYLIASSDDQILNSCDELINAGKISSCSVVFHCSGALPSSIMRQAGVHGAFLASVHPIRSFASPEKIVHDLAGTWCGMEGDQKALALLIPAFTEIGARLLPIDREQKVLYHAAAVFACNYSATLMHVAQQAYIKAGISPEVALALMAPLVRDTIENVFRLGPAEALTGPIARGDTDTVARQLAAVRHWDESYGALYLQLAELTAELAAKRNQNKS